MKKLLGILVAVGIVTLCFGQPASALVIDFEDIAVAPGTNSIGGDRISGGFEFDTQADHSHIANACFGADNGSSYLVIDDFNGYNPVVQFEALSGATFDLHTIDVSEWEDSYVGANALTVDFTGFRAGGGGPIFRTVTLDLVWDGIGPLVDFQTVTFDSAWSNLLSLTMKGLGATVPDTNYFAIDNIDVTLDETPPVPEPTTLLLLGSGFVGLAIKKRKTKF